MDISAVICLSTVPRVTEYPALRATRYQIKILSAFTYVFLPLITRFITPSYPHSHSPRAYNHLQFYDYETQRVVKQGAKASDLVN